MTTKKRIRKGVYQVTNGENTIIIKKHFFGMHTGSMWVAQDTNENGEREFFFHSETCKGAIENWEETIR